MNEVDIYTSIRAEIVENHVLMHWFSLIVAIVILCGILIIESRKTILSVFLPFLTVAWAASMVRFDYFIHRQIAYLRAIEPQIHSAGIKFQLWESWRQSLVSTKFIVPVVDIFICIAIVVPTIYILFGPSRQYFQSRQWYGGGAYAWGASIIIVFLLLSLVFIPQIVEWR